MTRAAAIAAALCFSALVPALAADQPPTPAPAMTPSPAVAPKGEFDDSCAMGLASGQVVKTDCSVNWTAPDGKVYCFSTEASKEAFPQEPRRKHCRRRASFSWQKDNAATTPAKPPEEVRHPQAARQRASPRRTSINGSQR